jgi:hypothetical protein
MVHAKLKQSSPETPDITAVGERETPQPHQDLRSGLAVTEVG